MRCLTSGRDYGCCPKSCIFYSRLLDLVEPLYLPWVSKAFQILRNNRDLGDLPFGETSAKFTGVEGLTVAAFYLAVDFRKLGKSTILKNGGL